MTCGDATLPDWSFGKGWRRLGNVALTTLPYFEKRRTQAAAFAEAERQGVPKQWVWLDAELADSRPFIARDSFSIVDISETW